MTIPEQIAAAIRNNRIHCKDEYGLQNEVFKLLGAISPDVRREVSTEKGRIDFVLEGIAIELKVDGSVNEVMRQLKRYAELPWVVEIFLISTRSKHRAMPATINGKPLRVSIVCAL